ncbi:NTP transferase domain-containing protein [Brevibacillus borstelensis]|uniref:sugar phosphate nucleotidyltransferase n=1 Tax=Brevibacillus TaxID=55080 RepID=UPI00148FB4BA|nr:sugar phosphate nucleotidyltransferase [Brevibacillus borstelensis]MED1852258.1 sugar phosphate nucleotidyltransferase [Brevibacillus borstelensis]MED1875684.1 sugar phosphate nucleotidyltransferase [Brevibacillus borstelensis]NOU56906.1 NTP transferase domain-containing protein [Brevibacillus borstelensis]
MKGMILAGGKGTRLYPLTNVVNKHLLPVGTFPMIFHPIYKLRQAGITDILIITGKEDLGYFSRLLGSGNEFQVRFTYRVQDRPGGIAEAVSLGKEFVGDSPFVVHLGDNLFQAELAPFIRQFAKGREKAHLLLAEVADPQHFGVAEFEGQRLIAIEEKPVNPKSPFAVTGIYMYRPDVFDIIEKIHPSSKGELEITDVNNLFISAGEATYHILPGWWEDAGTLQSYHRVNQRLQSVNLFSSSSTRPFNE